MLVAVLVATGVAAALRMNVEQIALTLICAALGLGFLRVGYWGLSICRQASGSVRGYRLTTLRPGN
jgi:hypothetical protein